MRKAIIVCLLAMLVFACQHQVDQKVSVPANLVYTPSTTTVIQGTAGASVSPTINLGTGSLTYAIISSVIEGISIESGTGIISWTSTVAPGSYDIFVTATNSAGMAATTYKLIVNSAVVVPVAPSGFTYSPGSTTILKGTAGSSGIPSINTGGTTVTYSISSAIPTGVTINSSTGEISWSSAVLAGTYTLVVKATNSVGTISFSYVLTVNNTATVTAPTSLVYNPATSVSTVGTAGNSATPSINNGLGTITYSLTGTIATGISIDPASGVISWTTALAAGSYTLSIKATNSAGSITASYTITRNAATTTTVSFAKDLLPTLTSSCGGCHSYTKTYSGVLSHTTGCSSIQDKIGTTYCTGVRMPEGKPALSAAFIAQFNAWIAQGKLNN